MQQSALLQVVTIQWKDAGHTDGREILRTADSWNGAEVCSATRGLSTLQKPTKGRCGHE